MYNIPVVCNNIHGYNVFYYVVLLSMFGVSKQWWSDILRVLMCRSWFRPPHQVSLQHKAHCRSRLSHRINIYIFTTGVLKKWVCLHGVGIYGRPADRPTAAVVEGTVFFSIFNFYVVKIIWFFPPCFAPLTDPIPPSTSPSLLDGHLPCLINMVALSTSYVLCCNMNRRNAFKFWKSLVRLTNSFNMFLTCSISSLVIWGLESKNQSEFIIY